MYLPAEFVICTLIGACHSRDGYFVINKLWLRCYTESSRKGCLLDDLFLHLRTVCCE